MRKIGTGDGWDKQKRSALIIFWAVWITFALLIIFHKNSLADPDAEIKKKICGCVLLAFTGIIFSLNIDRLRTLPIELYQNRQLIWKLAKNDFKKRYAGSYLGSVWAMAQPVVTVLMYWVVFEKILGMQNQLAASGVNIPYVLYLTAGLVPWFYFSDALMQGMMAMLEYNFLVKKVVFKISVLPIIKIIGALFTHIFFTGVLILMSFLYGYKPSIYMIQVIYYSFCLFMLVLALSYFNCAVVVFFRDLQQIINIGLQVVMWATPIMWNIEGFGDKYKMIFKLNPLTYIVGGFRTSMYGHEWFWEHFYSTTYFWILTISLFCISAMVFKKLKVHFADVL